MYDFAQEPVRAFEEPISVPPVEDSIQSTAEVDSNGNDQPATSNANEPPFSSAPADASAESHPRMPAEPNRPRHNLLRPGDVDRICEQQRRPGGLVAGFIGHRSLSVLVGDSGLGKSPFAYQLGICVAEGIPLLGMKTEPGLVVYADFENGLEESRSVRNNVLQFLEVTAPPENFLIWTPDCGDWLDIGGICEDERPALFVIDSLRAYKHDFEKTDVAGKEMQALRSVVSKSGTAILLIHHIRKPDQVAGYNLEDDDTRVTTWLLQAAGHRSIINQSDSRIAADVSRGVPDAALLVRWHRRIHGEGGPIYLERVVNDDGDPIGYKPLSGERLLGDEHQVSAYRRLPQEFTFRQAKEVYERADDPTRKWLLKCIAFGLVAQVGRGSYRREL